MSGMAMVKYAIALLGVAIVIFANRAGNSLLGYVGLGLIITAFFLRFVRRSKGPEDAG